MMEQTEITSKNEQFPLDEAQLRHLVRSTLQTATRPAPGRLSALMPPPPPATSFWTAWRRQAAALAVCLVLVLGGLGVYFTHPGVTITPLPGQLVTATATDTPTTTLAAWEPDLMTTRETAVSSPATHPTVGATPAPNPTPIAAAETTSLTN